VLEITGAPSTVEKFLNLENCTVIKYKMAIILKNNPKKCEVHFICRYVCYAYMSFISSDCTFPLWAGTCKGHLNIKITIKLAQVV
jgi:hypothetical protein